MPTDIPCADSHSCLPETPRILPLYQFQQIRYFLFPDKCGLQLMGQTPPFCRRCLTWPLYWVQGRTGTINTYDIKTGPVRVTNLGVCYDSYKVTLVLIINWDCQGDVCTVNNFSLGTRSLWRSGWIRIIVIRVVIWLFIRVVLTLFSQVPLLTIASMIVCSWATLGRKIVGTLVVIPFPAICVESRRMRGKFVVSANDKNDYSRKYHGLYINRHFTDRKRGEGSSSRGLIITGKAENSASSLAVWMSCTDIFPKIASAGDSTESIEAIGPPIPFWRSSVKNWWS